MSVLKSFIRTLDPYLLLLSLLTLFALTPLADPGYFYSAHDGRHSVFFVSMFDEAIRSGAFWPRWAMHHAQGYGYPTFVLQAPLAFYVAEIFILLGAGITTGVKLAWAVGFLGSAWSMYALVRHWTSSPSHHSKVAAVVAALLYVFVPYHLLDIYVRAALAETLMMAWFPLVFLAFDRLITEGKSAGWQGRLLLAALSLAALLLTHTFALLAFVPLLMLFVLFRLVQLWSQAGTLRTPIRQASWIAATFLAAAAGIAALFLSLVLILPLLAEGSLLEGEAFIRDTYNYQRHWVYWGQFFSPVWGYGYSDDPTGVNDGMGFQVGLVPLTLALMGIVGLGAVRSWRQRWLVGFLLLASAATLFAMTPGAAPFWAAVPTLSVIQFPWRLLMLVGFTMSLLGGLVTYQLLQAVPRETAQVTGLTLSLIIVVASFHYAHPQELQRVEPWREDGRAVFQFEQEHPDMIGFTRLVEEKFTETPLTAQYQAADFSNQQLERLAISAGSGEVISHYSQGHAFGGEVAVTTPATVQVRVYDYPGWQVRVNGQLISHRTSSPYGLVEVEIPPGRHRIDVWMGSTPTRTAGMLISGFTLMGLLGLWGWSKWRKFGDRRKSR